MLAAKHMVESGNWLVPHRGREFYAEKPPVFMWIQAATYEMIPGWRLAFLLIGALHARSDRDRARIDVGNGIHRSRPSAFAQGRQAAATLMCS